VLVSSNKLPNANLHHWNEEPKCMQNGWCYSAFLDNWPIQTIVFVMELWNKNLQFITSAPSSKFMLLWNLRVHHKFIHSFIPLACAEHDDSLPFSGASTIPLYYVPFPATLLPQLFFHPLSPHLAIYFLIYLSILLFPYSYIIPFWEFYFFPIPIHAQTNVIYLTLLSLL